MAGLTAAGQITSYVMTKHAVVGLSLALRSEAAAHGVGVLVVCPSAVETPILDKGAVGGFVGRDYFLQGQGVKTAYDADRLARDTLRAIERNKALLVKPRRAHAQWVFARLAPGLMQRMSIRFIAAPAGQPGARPLGDSLSNSGFQRSGWLRYGSGRNGYRIHADPEACAGRRDGHRHPVRRLLPAQLLHPHRGRRGGRLSVHAAVHPAQQAVRHRAVGDADPAGGIRVGDRAAWAVRVPRGRSDHQDGRESRRLGREDRPVRPRRQGAALRQRCAAPGAVHRRHGHPGLAPEFDDHRRAGRRPVAAGLPARGGGRRLRRGHGGDPVPVCVHLAVDQPRQSADHSFASSTRSARRSPTSTWRRWARW